MAAPIILQLTGIAHGGEAFGHHDGKIVFVPYALPGETARVEIEDEKTRWARARLVEIITASPDRIAPPCPYFGPGRCGGCQWQHIAYERQLALKQEIIADQLRRIGGIAQPPVLDAIALADDDGILTFHYRNHAHLLTDADGQPGYESSDGGILPVAECLLLHPLVHELHQALVTQNDERDTAVHRIDLRAGVNTEQQIILFETTDDAAPDLLIEDLPARCALRRRDGTIQPLIGSAFIEETIADQTLRISAASPFPANSVGAAVMVELASAMLQPSGNEALLVAHGGVGLFALSLAGQVQNVIAIEPTEATCEDFAWNARDLDNVMLFEGAIEDVLAAFPAPDEPPITELPPRLDMAVLEPPGSGAGPDVIAQLARLRIPTLLYVSYDPAGLARDARLLQQAGFTLREVQPVDLLPQTAHIASLALFIR